MPLEPKDVGPAAGGNLRVSDADRQQAITLLTTAVSEGRITKDEFDCRLTQAQNSVVFDDLVPLTRDLKPSSLETTANWGAGVSQQAYQPVIVDRVNANPAPENLIGILGGSHRSGMWRVRSKINTWSILGGHELDMTEAVFESDRIDIKVFSLLGGVEIKVPAGVRVESNCFNLLGGVEAKGLESGDGGPVIVLTGFNFMGGVEISGPKTLFNKLKKRIAGN